VQQTAHLYERWDSGFGDGRQLSGLRTVNLSLMLLNTSSASFSRVMQRLIARILFLTALLGTFVPIALAIGAPAPHQCCIRKSHAGSTRAQIEGVNHTGNCCPPRTSSVWAAPIASASLHCEFLVVPNNVPAQSQSPGLAYIAYKSVRAPPVSSIA